MLYVYLAISVQIGIFATIQGGLVLLCSAVRTRSGLILNCEALARRIIEWPQIDARMQVFVTAAVVGWQPAA